MRRITIIILCMFIFSILPQFLCVSSDAKETVILHLDVCQKTKNPFSSNADAAFVCEYHPIFERPNFIESIIHANPLAYLFIPSFQKEHPPRS